MKVTNVVIGLFLSANTIIFAQIVPTNPEDICPLLVGEKIGISNILNAKGETIRINDLVSKKPTVLVFFRGGWCPYCNAQLGGLQKVESKISKLGYQVIAISPDKISDMPATIEKNKMTYQLFSDPKMGIQQSFGIAYRNEQTIKNYGGLIQSASGEEHGMLPVPSVFVVDKNGKIRFENINPDIADRLDADVLMAVLEKLKL